jgi:hypothetical protein
VGKFYKVFRVKWTEPDIWRLILMKLINQQTELTAIRNHDEDRHLKRMAKPPSSMLSTSLAVGALLISQLT